MRTQTRNPSSATVRTVGAEERNEDEREESDVLMTDKSSTENFSYRNKPLNIDMHARGGKTAAEIEISDYDYRIFQNGNIPSELNIDGLTSSIFLYS